MPLRRRDLSCVLSAEPGTRKAAVELLEGIVTALAREADSSEDETLAERLPWLIADVLDTIDVLNGL